MIDIQPTYRVEESPSGQWRVLGPGGWSAILYPGQWTQLVQALADHTARKMSGVGPDAVVRSCRPEDVS